MGECFPVVAIPSFNHGPSVVDVASRAAGTGLQVIVIDDGSTDDTANRVQEWIACNRGTAHLIRHDRNLGKAAAILTGFRKAAELGATHLVTIDADGQLDPDDIPALLAASAEKPDALILGQRPARIEGCPSRCAMGRRLASLAILAQTGIRVLDTQCGLRVYPMTLLRSVHCRAARYAFEAEIITRASWAGFEIREIPVRCRYFEKDARVSHWKPWRDSIRQTVLHLRLAAEALMPWKRSRSPVAERTGGFRRFLSWLNPVRSVREIRHESIGDLELGCGLGMGVFIGTLPFYGLHTAMSLYVAWKLHQQPAAVVIGSQVSAPPLGIGLAAVSITAGHLLLHGALPDLSSFDLASMQFWKAPLTWFVEWLVGSVAVGFILALVAALAGMYLGRLMRSSEAPEAKSNAPGDDRGAQTRNLDRAATR